MSTFNIRQLEDRACDVDPDLRFMALEDFQKNLNDPKIQVRNVLSFIPILFNLLSDTTTEVQNQAVKSFSPLVRHIDDGEIVLVVARLYDAVAHADNTSKFTTSVPNLALRSIFNESYSRFSKKLARDVIDLLLPLLFASLPIVTIDNIEILIDLIKNLGSNLTLAEMSAMVTSLVTSAYRESGIISKRSIMAIDCVLQFVDLATSGLAEQTQFYDKVFADITQGYQLTQQGKSADNICLTVYQVALAHVKKAKDHVLSDASAQIAFDFIVGKVDLVGLGKSFDVEDLDIDVLVLENLVREDALITLSSLVVCIPYEVFVTKYGAKVVEIINGAVKYDPFSDQDSDAFSNDDDSEINFSDDEDEIEQFEDAGENDGLAGKLRFQSIVLLKHLLINFPQFIPTIYDEELIDLLIKAISDRSDLVSNEAIASSVLLIYKTVEVSGETRSRANSDVSMTTDGNRGRTPYARLCDKYFERYEAQIFDYLLTLKNIGRFSNTKQLVESLISASWSSLSDSFLTTLYGRLLEFRLTLKVYPDLIRLYKVILTNYDIDTIPSSLLFYIVEDLKRSLEDSNTYHSFIAEVLSVCRALFQLVSGNAASEKALNENFFESFASKINLKQLSSDVRQNLLNTLTSFVINLEVSQSNLERTIEIFQESLNYEVTVNFTIENLISVCNHKPELFSSQELCNLIVEKLNTYLRSSDASLYSSSLDLLDTIFEKTEYRGNTDELILLTSNVFDLLQITNDFNLMNKGFRIIGHSLSYINVDTSYFETLITKIVNPKLSDVDDVDLSAIEYLILQLTKYQETSGEELFAIGFSNLILKNFISAKILSIISLQNNLAKNVETAEEELIKFANGVDKSIPVDRITFYIQFLGCIASKATLSKVSFDDFFAILNSDSHEVICLAAARALGLCIARDLDKYLPILLECYLSSSNDDRNKGHLILVSIKQVLSEESAQQQTSSLKYIWDSIILVITSREGDLTYADVSELRLAGIILSQIADLDKSEDYQRRVSLLLDQTPAETCNQYVVYTAIVVIKQLLSSTNDEIDVGMIKHMVEFLPIPNLELKQAIVSTLLTGIYNKSVSMAGIINDVIMPKIYDELSAKEAFKKVIPMGPYKYVVDEGLEVRKLSYELISAIINVDTDKIENEQSCVNQPQLFEVLLVKGLVDSENDIVNLTVLNMLQLIQNDETILTKITNQHELIAALSKVISKKLRSKASAQELESYENTLRSVMRLSKVMNVALTNSNILNSEWNNYYHEIKNKHHLLFSAVEV